MGDPPAARPAWTIPDVPPFWPLGSPEPSRPWDDFLSELQLWKEQHELRSGQQMTAPQLNAAYASHLGPEGFRRFQAASGLDRATTTNNAYVTALTGVFRQPHSVVRAYYELTSVRLESGETINDLLIRLRKLAHDCDLANKPVEYFVALQLVCAVGTHYKSVQEKLLAEAQPDLQQFSAQLRAAELARADQAAITDGSVAAARKFPPARSQQRRAKQPRGGSDKPKPTVTCGNCGSNSHKSGSSDCPARDKECFKCHKMGHFRSLCLQTRLSQPSFPNPGRGVS